MYHLSNPFITLKNFPTQKIAFIVSMVMTSHVCSKTQPPSTVPLVTSQSASQQKVNAGTFTLSKDYQRNGTTKRNRALNMNVLDKNVNRKKKDNQFELKEGY